MIRRVGLHASTIFLTLLLALIVVLPVRGKQSKQPLRADSPYDLINAVNTLRASNGLPAYSINSTLMYTAGSHAEFMAATGNVSHTGAGGSSVTDRLLAAGYPLAGDLSLGGFRSENITGGSEGMTAQSAVDQWTGDALHLNTMLSPNLTEIGAGVAVANGRVYFVIDCARPTTAGASQGVTQSSGGGSGNVPIPVVAVSTPNEAGAVVHNVLLGQTLWQIAIAYNVKINDIKALNNLSNDNIFPGDTLLIKMDSAPATETPAFAPILTPTTTPAFVATNTTIPVATLPISTTPTPIQAASDNSTIMSFVIGLVALAILAGGVFAWRGNPPADSG
jgi:uncharacterized protein YkwD